MRRAALLALLVVLVAQPAHAEDDGEPTAETKAESAPVVFVTDIYKAYGSSGGPPPPESIYSERLQALLDKDGEAGRLDFDPIVDGQDWEIGGLKVMEIYQSGGEARVRATFANFGEPRNLLFSLVREDGQWRVDDIAETLRPRWTLSKILTGAPGAFPDAEEAAQE